MFQFDDKAVATAEIGFAKHWLGARFDAQAQALGGVFGAGQLDQVTERQQVAGAVYRQVAVVQPARLAERPLQVAAQFAGGDAEGLVEQLLDRQLAQGGRVGRLLFGHQALHRRALAIREDPGEALASQKLDVLLDQVALPLVIHALGGGRPGPGLAGLDGDVTCHYRDLPLLYARESDLAVETVETLLRDPRLAPLAEAWAPSRQIVLEGTGRDRIRPMFDRRMPLNEGRTRQILKKAGLWLR